LMGTVTGTILRTPRRPSAVEAGDRVLGYLNKKKKRDRVRPHKWEKGRGEVSSFKATTCVPIGHRTGRWPGRIKITPELEGKVQGVDYDRRKRGK